MIGFIDIRECLPVIETSGGSVMCLASMYILISWMYSVFLAVVMIIMGTWFYICIDIGSIVILMGIWNVGIQFICPITIEFASFSIYDIKLIFLSNGCGFLIGQHK